MTNLPRIKKSCPGIFELLGRAAGSQTSGRQRPDRIDRHLARCDRCRQEWNEILLDRRESERSNAATIEMGGRVPRFRIRDGILCTPEVFPFHSVGPIFRSRGGTVIHSSIVALEKDYVLLEVISGNAGMRLNLEKGRKKGGEIRISLYTDRYLSDSIFLRDRLSWDLNTFIPGDYRLKLDGKTVLKFNIQE